MEHNLLATEEEIAKLIYDSDIYEGIREVAQGEAYNEREIINIITVNINSHFGSQLEAYDMRTTERDNFLTGHIEDELKWYLLQRRNK